LIRDAIRNAKGIATANATINHTDENQFATAVATSAKLYVKEIAGIVGSIIRKTPFHKYFLKRLTSLNF